MKKILFFSILTISLISCVQTKETTATKEKKVDNSTSITCQLIEKEFTHKGGKLTEVKELHLRCSIQDYFIKLCESNVTEEQLKLYLNKGIEVKMEIKEGLLDHCESIPEYAQSRIGTYIIITEIIE